MAAPLHDMPCHRLTAPRAGDRGKERTWIDPQPSREGALQGQRRHRRSEPASPPGQTAARRRQRPGRQVLRADDVRAYHD